MLHMFLERSVTIMFRDVGTVEQVLNWTNRSPFLEKSLDYISSRISPVLSLFRRSSICYGVLLRFARE